MRRLGLLCAFLIGATWVSAAAPNRLAPPTLTSVTPSVASTAGGTVLTLQGTNLTSGITVLFDGVPGTVYHPTVSGSRALVVAPPHSAGSVTVTVTSTLGESVSQASLLTYVEHPAIGVATAVVRASLTSAGEQVPHTSTTLDILSSKLSGDGNIIAFAAESDFGFGRGIKLYAKNLQTGTLALISACGDCGVSSISHDGTRVAFQLFGPGGAAAQHYMDAPFETASTRIDSRADGVGGNARSTAAALSSDGRFAAFSSQATNLDDSTTDTAGSNDLFVKDLQTGALERWTTGQTVGAQAISGDGRVIAFTTAASLLPTDTNALVDVYLLDRIEGLPSLQCLTVGANASSSLPALSADGSTVAFTSLATNLVTGDTNGVFDVFVMDVDSSAVSRVSVSSHGAQASLASSGATMSADGRFVAFISASADIVPGDLSGTTNLFVHDRMSEVTFLADADANGVMADGNASSPSMSADGLFVSFLTSASNLLPGDTNAMLDLYRKAIPQSWRHLVLSDVTIQRGQTGTQAVSLIASGYENAVGFSVTFDPALVMVSSVALGAGAGSATLVVNETQKANGRVGVLVGLPAGQAWSARTRELVTLTFAASSGSEAATAVTTFGDTPVVREVADAVGETLAATFTQGTVTLEPAPAAVAPAMTTHPEHRTVTAGQTATFTAAATGTPTPTYRWQVSTNGGGSFTNLSDGAPYGGTSTATLTVTGTTMEHNGYRYRVVATNVVDSATSTAATLTVQEPLPVTAVSMTSSTFVAGGSGTVTVRMNGNGTENAAGFSVVFDPAVLSLTNVAIAGGASGATLVVNQAQASAGRVGVLLGLPAGQAWTAGSRDLVTLTFTAAGTVSSTTIGFGDTPVVREVANATGEALDATFTGRVISIEPATPRSLLSIASSAIAPGASGVVVVRMTGDGSENAAGFSVNFDPAVLTLTGVTAGSGAGSGASLVTNQTQAASGRVGVLIGLPAGQTWDAGERDLVTLTFTAAAGASVVSAVTFGDTPVVREVADAGGIPVPAAFTDGTVTVTSRRLALTDATIVRGQNGEQRVRLTGDGTENAAGFTVVFDPALVTVSSVALAADAGSATLVVNEAQKSSGRIGVLLGLPAGQTWAVGTRDLVVLTVAASSGTTPATAASAFGDVPVVREVASVLGEALATNFVPGALTLEPPSLNVAPAITTPPTNRTINAGQNTTFTAAASGTPTPTYRWQVSTNGGTSFTNLSDGAPYSGTSTTTLTITAAPATLNGHQYRVVATNVVDAAISAAATLTVQSAPGAPTNVVGTRGNGQVSVTFSAPADTGGATITGYTVTASPGALTATGAGSPIVVAGLTNGTAYTFTVVATNSVGTGPASAPSTAVIPATVPGAPTNVVGTRGDAQVSVAFSAPASNGGLAITGFTVTASPGGASTSGLSSPMVVAGLTNGTAYTFTVRAINAVGTGPASSASAAVTPAAPPTGPLPVLQAFVKASNAGEGDTFERVAVSGDTMVVGALGESSIATGVNGAQLNNAAQFAGAAYVYVRNGSTWTQQAYLKPSNTGAGDYFGMAVAIDGDTIVIGAPREDGALGAGEGDNSATESGAAYVFVRQGTTWTQTAYLKASNANAFDFFGTSVAIHGNTIAVGAPGEDSPVGGPASANTRAGAGAAYVFARQGATWVQQALLKGQQDEFVPEFGTAVDVHLNRVAVGAPRETTTFDSGGAVYVFLRTGEVWTREARVLPGNPGQSDLFGTAVALDGSYLAVGAPGESGSGRGVNPAVNDSASGAGAAYMFEFTSSTWHQTAYVKASNTDANDRFGVALAIADDLLAVGASFESSGASGPGGNQASNTALQSGAAYLFRRSEAGLAQTAYVKASNSQTLDRFGSSVAIDGATFAVGAPGEDSAATGINGGQSNNGASFAGAVYVYGVLDGGTTFLHASPSTLRFSATKSGTGGAITAVTAPQTVTVSSFGTTVPEWTATSDQSWAVVTGGAGTGAGTFSVAIFDPGNAIGGATSLTATITLTAANAGAVMTVPLQLTVHQLAGVTAPPIGRIDSPAQNLAGVQGAFGITGWVVDDVGIEHIRVYRQCLSFENQAACSTVLGNRVVFVGTAYVVPGARPDVEATYAHLPASNAAGWGFLVLSNVLPNIPASTSIGGVGTFHWYVVATDKEGHQKILGRTVADATPTTVTVTNDTISKPFGSIDTPGQGATVSGLLNNFGWALTPDSNTVGDEPGDIVVPTNGSTITVYIDGNPVGNVTYDLCRGTVGNPVPPGVLCNDDVSSRFRANGRHRNLDAGRGPIGLRSIDTRTLSNGLHTIQWGVTDSAGRGEGLGSRFFAVLNNSARGPVGQESSGRGVQGAWTPGALFGRTGFNPAQALVPVAPVAGVPTIRVAEFGRVELHLEGVSSVTHVANGTERPAPVGMAVDSDRGVVSWSIGPGYLGTYRLRLYGPGATVEDSDGVVVDVVVEPMALAELPVRMRVDRADVHGATITLHGWALDPQAATGEGIGTVHVWGRRRSPEVPGARGSEVQGPIFLGTAQLGVSRPDVAAAHGEHMPNAGFVLHGVLPDAGEWEITAYVWVARTGRFEDARTVTVVRR